MSNSKKEKIMHQKISENESALIKFFSNIEKNYDIFVYEMLNDFSVNVWIPFLSDIIQYLHIFFFPFKENVSYYFYS
jgi:hypothetical protein